MQVTNLAIYGTKKRITFTFQAPEAKSVHIAGSFNNWNICSDPLKQGIAGMWKRALFLEPDVYEYRFIVDGVWFNDTDAPEARTNEFGSSNCVIWV